MSKVFEKRRLNKISRFVKVFLPNINAVCKRSSLAMLEKLKLVVGKVLFKHYANGPAFDCLNYENMIAKLTAMALADLL